jgi:predicted nucleic acid-binding protein
LRNSQENTRASGLIDTGAILALLDNKDRWHERCVGAYQSLRVPLATSAAVLTELFYLTDIRLRQPRAAWGFLRSGVVTVLPIDSADLPALDELMRRYADRPMDFADATLVHLARRESLTTVFTLDHDDFETYRIDGRRRFRIVPGR